MYHRKTFSITKAPSSSPSFLHSCQFAKRHVVAFLVSFRGYKSRRFADLSLLPIHDRDVLGRVALICLYFALIDLVRITYPKTDLQTRCHASNGSCLNSQHTFAVVLRPACTYFKFNFNYLLSWLKNPTQGLQRTLIKANFDLNQNLRPLLT